LRYTVNLMNGPDYFGFLSTQTSTVLCSMLSEAHI